MVTTDSAGRDRRWSRAAVVAALVAVAAATGTVGWVAAGGGPPEGAAAAARPWTSLDTAAGRPVGIGDRGLAEDLRGSRPDVGARTVIRSPEAGSGGCVLEYGTGGQCLPLVPPSQAAHVAAGHAKPVWACPEVRRYFAAGLVLVDVGVDPLRLDRDRDGTACGAGDA